LSIFIGVSQLSFRMLCAVCMEHGLFGDDMGIATKRWNERYLDEIDGPRNK